jgi:hypothetical protein
MSNPIDLTLKSNYNSDNTKFYILSTLKNNPCLTVYGKDIVFIKDKYISINERIGKLIKQRIKL